MQEHQQPIERQRPITLHVRARGKAGPSCVIARQLALSRRKQGFESPRERQLFQILTALMSLRVQRLSNKRL